MYDFFHPLKEFGELGKVAFFRAYYDKKAAQGLKYMNIIGHVTKKMTAVIFAILRDNKVYAPALPAAS